MMKGIAIVVVPLHRGAFGLHEIDANSLDKNTSEAELLAVLGDWGPFDVIIEPTESLQLYLNFYERYFVVKPELPTYELSPEIMAKMGAQL